MPRGDKPADADRQRPAQSPSNPGQRGAARADPSRPAWPAQGKPRGGVGGAGRKVAFGPTGGLGRKTNLSRSR